MTQFACKLALIALALGAITASAEDYHPHCTAASVEGDYALHIMGDVYTPGGTVSRDGIALTHFDGDHRLTQVDYVLSNGVPPLGPVDGNGFNDDESGTYTVHENCTGQAEIDFPTPPGGTSGVVLKYYFIVSDAGRQLSIIVYSITPPNSTTPLAANIHADAVKVHNHSSF